MRWLLSILAVSFSLPLVAQEREVHFLDCPDVAFFEPRCVLMPEAEVPEPEPVPLAAPVVVPAHAPVLLFPKETLAPTTPPLMVQLLNEPTEANARLFLAWSQERQERGQLVQELLKQLLTPGKE